MASNVDLSADDLKIFVQEAEDLLELLEESIVMLEQDSQAEDLLNDIFREAHTLKGSSGMLGLDDMTHLTHAMEDLLDRVRKGELAVTPELVDALLMSLDGLKVLKDNLANSEDAPLDIDPIVAMLHAAAEAGAGDGGGAAKAEGPARTLVSVVVGDAEIEASVATAATDGQSVLRLLVKIDPESDWAAVRCFQILNELDGLGLVLASVPTQEDIEQEQVGHELEALLVTAGEASDIEVVIAKVEDVVQFEASAWDAEAAATEAAEAQSSAAAASTPTGGAGDAQAQLTGAAQRIDVPTTVRIDVEQIDALMNMVGELVIDRTRVAQLSRLMQQRFKDDEYVRSLAETSTHIAKVVDELHESMMQVRMLPVGMLFSKFPRLVRDLARTLDKDIRLEMEGEDTEIDRSVIEQIKDPLVHLIRNAVDHGVESKTERQAAGKPERSILRLTAEHEQGQIVISLTDDGKGIEAASISAAAVRKGVITAETAARLSEQEAVELVFLPGFSTAAETTEVSGRGVGMDIVRSQIEALNGRVEVETEIGAGTTFRLRLPLTLATFRGLLVARGGTTYALPMTYVQETLRVDSTMIGRVSNRPVLTLRGTTMAMLWLDEVLGMQGAEHTEDERPYVIVVKASDSDKDRPVALAVDELVDQQEVVVKSLSGFLGRAQGISGASILGDGQVVLILDVATLIKTSQKTDGGPVRLDAPEFERSAAA